MITKFYGCAAPGCLAQDAVKRPVQVKIGTRSATEVYLCREHEAHLTEGAARRILGAGLAAEFAGVPL